MRASYGLRFAAAVGALLATLPLAGPGCTSLLPDMPDPSADGGADAGRDATVVRDQPDASRDAVAEDEARDARADAPDAPTCAVDQLACGDACFAKDDPRHCGSCAHDCTSLPNVSGAVTCEAGVCVVPPAACAPGWAHCSAAADDGCEADLGDTSHCGSCSTACAAPTPVCAARTTAGPSGGYQCTPSCVAPLPDVCGQSCVSKASDPLNCGDCGTECKAPANGSSACVASKCTMRCDNGFHDCGGVCVSNGSVDTCGDRCARCPDAPGGGSATCSGGTCGFTCAAPTTACGSGCVNVAADPSNCGSCGHSCDGATCSGSACQPVAILSGRVAPNALTSEASSLYWMESNIVMKCAEAACVATTLSARCDPPLVVMNGRAYCTGPYGIYSVPVTGGADSTFYTSAVWGNHWALASSAGQLVFQLTDRSAMDDSGPVMACAGGATCTAPTTLFTLRPAAISTSSAGLAFDYEGVNGIVVAPTLIDFCTSIANCADATRVTGFRDVSEHVSLSPGGAVYFTAGQSSSPDGQTITGCPSSGCTTETPVFRTTAADVAFIVSDAQGVYWGLQNAVYGCPGYQCANASTPLAVSTTGNVNSATLDGNSLFYATDTAIYRLVR